MGLAIPGRLMQRRPAVAALAGPDQAGLVGSRRILSYRFSWKGEPPCEILGAHPNGGAILSPEGYATTLLGAGTRVATPGAGDAARAALHRHLRGMNGRLPTRVEMSWNRAWEGSEMNAAVALEEGDRLRITSLGVGALDHAVYARER